MSLSSCHHGPKLETNKPVRTWNEIIRLFLYMYCITVVIDIIIAMVYYIRCSCYRCWKWIRRPEFKSWMNLFAFYIALIKVKLATVDEGNPKAPLSIATTSRCRGGYYSILWITPLYPYLIMLSVKHGVITYHFSSLWHDSTWDWILISRTLVNTLHIRPMARLTLIPLGNIWIKLFFHQAWANSIVNWSV